MKTGHNGGEERSKPRPVPHRFLARLARAGAKLSQRVTRQRSALVIGLTLFVIALAFRTCGLSHDLNLGRVYHPDTRKQVQAVEQFLDGHYYTVVGIPDYEGYPLFNSHLVEYLVRAYHTIATPLVRHTGWAESVDRPQQLTLYAITRLLNAILSAAAVLLVVVIGWRWLSPMAGIIAGLLLLLSPADIIACHYANGDSTAAFLGLASLYFSLRLLDKPSWPSYTAAGLLAAAAFSSKYHGGIALGSAGLAHILHYARHRRLFSPASLRNGLVLILAVGVGILLTSPALLVFPAAAFNDIVNFFRHTASFGMTSEMRALSLLQRFRMGMSVNMPVLADGVGLIPALAALAALAVGRRRAAIWVIAMMPLAYIGGGLATKPLAHVVYHTMATPGIMLLAGFSLQRLACGGGVRLKGIRRAATVLLLFLALGHLARHAHRELFFFRHNDTNHLGFSWALDNVPQSFTFTFSPYTFKSKYWSKAPIAGDAPAVTGHAYVFSDRTRFRPSRHALHAHTFVLEDEKLYPFRNWPQHLFIAAPSVLHQMGLRPGFQPVPSPHPQNLIDATAPWWTRHPATRDLSAGQHGLRGSLVTTNRLPSAAWLIRNGAEPAHLELTFGRRKHTLRLDPDAALVLPIDDPRPMRLFRAQRLVYRYAAYTRFGQARVSLLTSPRDRAWALFNTAHFTEALTWLPGNEGDARPRGDRIMQEICARAGGGEVSENPVDTTTPIHLLEEYGVASAYLQQLPGLAWTPDDWRITKRGRDEDNSLPPTLDLYLPACALEPGLYTCRLDGLDATITAELVVRDALDRPLEQHTLRPPTLPGGPHTASFAVAPDDGWLTLQVRLPIAADHPTPAVTSITIRPDHERTLDSYRQLLAFMRDEPLDTPLMHRFWHMPLQRYGDELARAGDAPKARRMLNAALRASSRNQPALEALLALPGGRDALAPDLAALRERYDALDTFREFNTVRARFAGGAELRGYQITARRIKAGESFALRTHWYPDRLHRRLVDQAVWLHAIPEGGNEIAFQGDQRLIDLLRTSRPDEATLAPAYHDIQVPPTTTPGRYVIKTGVWIPTQRKPLQIIEADTPHEQNGIVLTPIDVVN
ncbi:MAG: glycosyltransferase family 39 protein [Kiritimatiellia bacterium]|nr:glycosyltransferase family 39 protein [Kiritimatiellia bacterium]